MTDCGEPFVSVVAGEIVATLMVRAGKSPVVEDRHFCRRPANHHGSHVSWSTFDFRVVKVWDVDEHLEFAADVGMTRSRLEHPSDEVPCGVV